MRTVTLIGVDGTEHVLACPGGPYYLRPGSGLWGGVSHNLISRQVAGLPGRRFEQAVTRTNLLTVPIAVEASTQNELDQRIAALASVLDPSGEVTIRYQRPDGGVREITAHLKGGFEAVTVTQEIDRVTEIPLVFEAFQPYWRSTSQNIVEELGAWNNGFFSGSNPLTLVNGGDVNVWPEFTFTGEIENIEVINLSTGHLWRIKRIIQFGETLRVVTEPEVRAVYINDQLDWSALDEISEFFPLRPRDNNVVLRAIGPNSADIGAYAIRYRELFQTC